MNSRQQIAEAMEQHYELMRFKIALDMQENYWVKLKVEQLLGIERCKERYPEAYQDRLAAVKR
jgi:hypothetical protein